MDEKCNRLEEEILMLNYQASRKRSSDLSWDIKKSKIKRSRPTSYGVRMLYFIDPDTIQRCPFTFASSI